MLKKKKIRISKIKQIKKIRSIKIIMLIVMMLLLLIAQNGFSCVLATDELNSLQINSKKYVVYDRESGLVLLGKNENKQTAMASTTKIMTAIVVVESNLNLEKESIVSQKAASIGGSTLGLKKDDKITINDLLYGLLMRSGNDCAIQLALECSGSVEEFAIQMNEKAKKLELKNTNFVTPHGLDNPNHYTTAYELAKITDYALKNNLIATIVKTKYATIRINNNNKEIKNTNELLLGNVDGVYGVKTGFTNIAGRCLVTAVKRKEMDLIIIVIGADTKKYRGTDTLKLLDYVEKTYKKEDIENRVKDAFQNWKEINENRIQIYKGNSKLNTKIGEVKYKKLLTKSEINVDFNNVILLKAPVEKNQKIGEIIVRNGEVVLEKIDILSEEKIEKRGIKDYFIIFAKEFTH